MEYFVTCNGIPVHVSETGKGDKAIILLHGYLETLYIWEEFRSLLPDSSRIVSIDLPGLGLTGSDPFINSMQFDAKVLLDLLDKLGIMRPYIVGHSMGGYVAQRFLRDYPGRIAGMVNIKDFILNGKLVQLAQVAVPNMYCRSNLRKFDEKITETVEICEMHDPQGVAAVLRGLVAREDNVELLKSPSVPVMFVYGDSDVYYPLEEIERIKADLPGCKHVVVPGTGHNTFIEDPGSTAALILDFIQ